MDSCSTHGGLLTSSGFGEVSGKIGDREIIAGENSRLCPLFVVWVDKGTYLVRSLDPLRGSPVLLSDSHVELRQDCRIRLGFRQAMPLSVRERPDPSAEEASRVFTNLKNSVSACKNSSWEAEKRPGDRLDLLSGGLSERLDFEHDLLPRECL